MSEKLRTSTVIAELERVYDVLADEFGLKFERPLITVQSRGRKNALGWYAHNRWAQDKEESEERFAEINICAENLHKGPIETLIHEMVHYANAFGGVNDCSGNQYHNKHFRKTAEGFGLNVEKMEGFGYARTSLSDSLCAMIDTKVKPNYGVFSVYRGGDVTGKKGITKMKKYSCGCTNVRCAVELDAVCQVCGEQFERA